MSRPSTLVSWFVVLSACRAPSGREAPPPIALVPGVMGDHLPVSTRSREAQSYFDQGLALYWGFDHEEAQRSFARAAQLDPGCALAYWGSALAAGPNINNPTMDDERNQAAFAALQKARANESGATPLERELIDALSQRYASPPPPDRRALDEAYANAMRDVWHAHPQEAEAGALFAESLMDLRPWDLFKKDGQPQPGTPEILATISSVLAAHPRHVGANHLAIYAWEMSPTPEKALPSADLLRTLVPGASHLVHMPAHIDVRLGHYDEAVRANQKAVEAGKQRVARSGPGGFFAIYRAHNYHFLVYAAQFEGRYHLAIDGAREMVHALPGELVDAMPQFVEGFLATPLHVLVRFGKWQAILAEPEPPARLPGTLAIWHYARGLALSALGRIDEAAAEQASFEQASAAVPEDYTIGNNPTRTVLAIGRAMLAGELEYRRGNFEAAFAALGDAVAQDEALRYDEPWGWFQPPAHALGALLLEQGRLAEAEAVYRRDLVRHPDNGWALFGLEECQRRAGRTAEADATHARFLERWKRADVTIRASCYCRTGAGG